MNVTDVVTVHAPGTVPVQQPSSSATLTSMILSAARDPSIPLERVERLMEMFRTEKDEERKLAFRESMASAQNEMRAVTTDKRNDQTRSRYATYAQLDSAIRPIYTKHGFAVSYDTETILDSRGVEYLRVWMFLSHDDGHETKRHIDMPIVTKGPKGNDVMTPIHATGSALTYGKRYLLGGVFNIAVGDLDDDGNAAGGNTAITNSDVPISDGEVKVILELVEEAGINLDDYLQFRRIESIEDLTKSQFSGAVGQLQQRKRNKKEKEEQAKAKATAGATA